MTASPIEQNFLERHRDKIAFGGPAECWIWTASRASKGYGRVWTASGFRRAHRAAYEAVHGHGSAAELVVRHRCDTPACVNPAHLEIGTHADNMRDRDERGRQVTPRGEANGGSKLTEDDVRTIRALYVRGSKDFSQRALARRFRVDSTIIGDIVRRERWAHVA